MRLKRLFLQVRTKVFHYVIPRVVLLTLIYGLTLLKIKQSPSNIEAILSTIVKGEFGQLMPAKVMGNSAVFLDRRFPTWTNDSVTYMVPQAFVVDDYNSKTNGKQVLGHSGAGVLAKKKIHGLLKLMGDRNKLGMFVIQGLEIKDSNNPKKTMCEDKEYVPGSQESQECDFVIFHHHLGILSMEIQNHQQISNQQIENAEAQLEKSHAIAKTLASINDEIIDFPMMKILALPSTEKANFVKEDFPGLRKDTILLFQENCQNIEAFDKWWKDVIEISSSTASLSASEPYKAVLSFTLMIRHLGPLKQSNHMTQLHQAITSFKYYGIQVSELIPFLFKSSYYHLFENIISYLNKMRREWKNIDNHISKSNHKENLYSFTSLTSLNDLNELDNHLSEFAFIEGDVPTLADKQLFKKLTCHTRLSQAHLPFVMTQDQLTVFEGPLKQLIIGPPGSGKTELMKFKAFQLDRQIRSCEYSAKILYLIANGSPTYDRSESLLFVYIKDFFKNSSMVEVMSVVLEIEAGKVLNQTVAILREKIASGEYAHVFIDEYWIGSKPEEHGIILELLNGVPGYVWISSVFDFHHERIHTKERLTQRTQPLLTALTKNGGRVNYLFQVLRTTDNIATVEREYSYQFKERDYPNGPPKIHGHSLKGLPITWSVETTIDSMYKKAAQFADEALSSEISLNNAFSDKISLEPTDISIVNFAVRAKKASNVSTLEETLESMGIQFWTPRQNIQEILSCRTGKVTVINSYTRDNSSYLDGVEWPMVIVILPSGVFLRTTPLSDKAEKLRNYDPYISFFRSMVKLVVISDKWRTLKDFLSDVQVKLLS